MVQICGIVNEDHKATDSVADLGRGASTGGARGADLAGREVGRVAIGQSLNAVQWELSIRSIALALAWEMNKRARSLLVFRRSWSA